MVVLLVYFWVLTYGTWNLWEVDDQRSFYDRFYDAQAFSLLQGRLDVPAEAIGHEAFVHNGKTYGYFGLGPAVLRAPLLALFPSLEGRLSRVFMLLACAANLVVVYQLIHTVRGLYRCNRPPSALDKAAYALFFLLAGLGSTNIYLASDSGDSNEAIMLGATFGLLFYQFFMRYFINGQRRCLLLACLFAFFCFITRASVGVGPLFALLLFIGSGLLALFQGTGKVGRSGIIWPKAGPHDAGAAPGVRHLGVVGATVLGTVCFQLGINYTKWESFDGMPLNKYVNLRNQREAYEAIEGKGFHLSNLRTGLYNYFSPDKTVFSNIFPWVYPTSEVTRFPESKLFWSDWWSGIPTSKPALFFLSALGFFAAFLGHAQRGRKMLRICLLGSLAGGAAIIVIVGYAERYIHDLYPFMLLAGVAGLHVVLSLTDRLIGRIACAVVVLLTVFSIWANTAFVLVFQREYYATGDFPNKWSAAIFVEFQEWRGGVDQFFGQTSLSSLSGHEPAGLGLEGSIDNVDSRYVSGWAWIGSRPNKAVYVDIYVGDTFLARCPAHLFRQDSLEARIGNGRHGFKYPLPTDSKDGGGPIIGVKVSGTDFELPGSVELETTHRP